MPEYKQAFQYFYLVKSNTVSKDWQRPTLSFEKIRPTEYLVQIFNVATPFYVNFLESFNPNLQLLIEGRPLSEDKHYVGNGYANTWLVEKTGTYTATIEYRTQKMFIVGTWLTLSSLILLFVLAFMFFLKRRPVV